MEISRLAAKIKSTVYKYKYVVIILLVGVALMLLPDIEKDAPVNVTQVSPKEETSLEETLSHILSKVYGAGKVEVMLNIAEGEKTVYQMDEDITNSDTNHADRTETVTLTDSQRNQFGLVQQVNPPVYLGAVVLCQGASDPVVKLSIVEAVSKTTGLSTNQICVLKMQ